MRSLLNAKKGQIGALQGIVITLVVIGVVLGIGLYVLNEFYDNLTAGTEAALAVNDTISAIGDISTWLGIIVIVVIAAIILAILFGVMPKMSTSV